MTEQAQMQKLRFLEDFMRVTDEAIIAKLSDVLQRERAKRAEGLRKMTQEELEEKLRRSEEDEAAGRTFTHEEVKTYFAVRFKSAAYKATTST
jgi:predicted transcriptional regulator